MHTIKTAKPNFDLLPPDTSSQAVDFITKCLKKQPFARPTVAKLLQHPWLEQVVAERAASMRMSRQLRIGANLEQFAKTTTPQAWVSSIIANLIVSTEQLHEAKAAFIAWDTKQDGMLDQEEINEHMSDICSYFNIEAPKFVKIFQAIDSDNNGEIDFTEFVTAAIDKKELLSDENLLRAFKILDRSGTGRISNQDFRQLLQTNAASADENDRGEWDKLILQMDSDSDGYIDFAEFKAHMGQARQLSMPLLRNGGGSAAQ